MNKLLLLSLSCLAISCGSTNTKNKDYVSKYMNTITADDLKTHLYIVASDEMQGRNTGEEGQKKQVSTLLASTRLMTYHTLKQQKAGTKPYRLSL